MAKIEYIVKFLDYWHIGSGISGGVLSDALVLKDSQGYPYVPGKTIKGLVREMAVQREDIEFVRNVLGIEGDSSLKETYISNAIIKDSIDPRLIPLMFEKLTFTAIDKNGVAQDKSLRDIEFVLPLELYGFAVVPDGWEKKFSHYLRSIKRMGLMRNRGFGRCQIIVKDGDV